VMETVKKRAYASTSIFLLKVLALSGLISILIKYCGPLLPLPAPFSNSINSLVIAIVLFPSLLLAVLLLISRRSEHEQKRKV